MKNKIRNSNIELLRIIAIIMVITIHYLGNSFEEISGLNYYFASVIKGFIIIAVNLFVISSSWFLINSKNMKVTKIIRLVFIAYFYGSIFWLLAREFSNIDLIFKSVNPFLINNYWFIKVYILMYLIHPFLNIVIKNINKKQYKGLLTIMSIFFCVWPSFLPHGPNNDGGYGIITFIYIFFITGYIKKYNIEFKKNLFITYICCALITTIFSLVKGTWNPWGYNFIFNIIGAFALFLFFNNMNFENKVINNMAKFSFPIYLIHFNPIVVSVLYFKILKIDKFYNSKYFLIHMIISVIVIYFVSFCVEYIRILVKKLLGKIFKKQKQKINVFEEKIDTLIYEKFYSEDKIIINT